MRSLKKNVSPKMSECRNFSDLGPAVAENLIDTEDADSREEVALAACFLSADVLNVPALLNGQAKFKVCNSVISSLFKSILKLNTLARHNRRNVRCRYTELKTSMN